MVKEFKFPDVGEGIQEGELVKWRVAKGDAVKADQILAEVETDKAVVELPSPAEGTILQLHAKPGDTIAVGQVLVTIGDPGEVAPEAPTPAPPAKKIKATETPQAAGSVVGLLPEAIPDAESPEGAPKDLLAALAPQVPTSIKDLAQQPAVLIDEQKILALPSTRRLARDLGVPLSRVKGTGPKDRITNNDVRRYAENHGLTMIAPPSSISLKPFLGGTLRDDEYGLVEAVPLRGVRRATARRMVEAASTAVLVTHTDEADVTQLYELRHSEKERAKQHGIKLTFIPFIIKAVIAALKQHPSLNASLDEKIDEIHFKRYYNIGIAVDTPEGLIVPVIKNADRLTIYQLATQLETLIDQTNNRTISLADLRGGTFTITNVGVYGGIYATPIINPPQSAILATGAIRPLPRVIGQSIIIRQILPLSISFDHRIIDGAEAARFTNTLREFLAMPARIFMEPPTEISDLPRQNAEKPRAH